MVLYSTVPRLLSSLGYRCSSVYPLLTSVCGCPVSSDDDRETGVRLRSRREMQLSFPAVTNPKPLPLPLPFPPSLSRLGHRHEPAIHTADGDGAVRVPRGTTPHTRTPHTYAGCQAFQFRRPIPTRRSLRGYLLCAASCCPPLPLGWLGTGSSRQREGR